MSTTHTTFVLGLKNHDPETWERFVSIYHPRLAEVIRQRGVPDHEAKDLLHDVFVKLYHVIPKYQQSKGSLRGWLQRITVNTVLDWHRKRKRKCGHLTDVDGVPAKPKTYTGIGTVHRTLFQQALTHLRERTRETTWACFEKHAMQGQQAADVAFELGVSVNAVYINSSRVLSQLRAYCERGSES